MSGMNKCLEHDYSREDNVLTFKICLVPILMKAWGKNNFDLSVIMSKYNLLSYVDASYEIFNTMGIKGVIEDLESFVEEQGGSVV